jgi:hypothetical protein
VLRATGVENLDLYQARRDPRFHDVRVRPLQGDAYEISYSHEYPAVARATTQQFVSAALNTSAQTRRFRESAWRDMSWNSAPPASRVEVISGASDPRRSGSSSRVWFLAAGVLAGLLLAVTIRRPNLALPIGAIALVACVVAVAWPRRYTSSAELRFVAPLNPAVWYAPSPPEPFASRVAGIREVEAVKLAAMLADVRIDPLPPASFRISVTTRDPYTAQLAVRKLVTAVMEGNVLEQRRYVQRVGGEIRDMAGHFIGERLEVIQAASYPTASLH